MCVDILTQHCRDERTHLLFFNWEETYLLTNIKESKCKTTPYNRTMLGCSILCITAASFKNSVEFEVILSWPRHLIATCNCNKGFWWITNQIRLDQRAPSLSNEALFRSQTPISSKDFSKIIIKVAVTVLRRPNLHCATSLHFKKASQPGQNFRKKGILTEEWRN